VGGARLQTHYDELFLLNCHPERTLVRERPAFSAVSEGTRLVNRTDIQHCASFRAGLDYVASPRLSFEARRGRASRGEARRELRLIAFILLLLALLSGCGHKKTAKNRVPPPPTVANTPAAPKTEANAKPAPPPTVEVPKHAKPIYVETGLASWYGPPYHNRRGANGEIYDQNALTAAHRTLPMNSVVRVTNDSTKHSVVVRITDRGPFIEDRVIDLSVGAAKAVDVWRPGTAVVKIEVLSTPAAINEGGRWCVQIGAFQSQKEARKLKEKLQDRYGGAQVIQFTGPTGEWVRIRPEGDDKRKAQEVASKTRVKEGGVFLVRLD